MDRLYAGVVETFPGVAKKGRFLGLVWRMNKPAFQYPSIINSLLRAESDITARVLSYALSADIVNTFI